MAVCTKRMNTQFRAIYVGIYYSVYFVDIPVISISWMCMYYYYYYCCWFLRRVRVIYTGRSFDSGYTSFLIQVLWFKKKKKNYLGIFSAYIFTKYYNCLSQGSNSFFVTFFQSDNNWIRIADSIKTNLICRCINYSNINKKSSTFYI